MGTEQQQRSSNISRSRSGLFFFSVLVPFLLPRHPFQLQIPVLGSGPVVFPHERKSLHPQAGPNTPSTTGTPDTTWLHGVAIVYDLAEV